MKTKPPSHNSSVGYNIHHFEWCTKYRYKMFRRAKYKKLCEEALRTVSERYGIGIRELSVMPEHVHLSVELPPDMSQSRALHLLKGGSSYLLFRAEPKFRLRYPRGNFWSKGKYIGSTGPADVERIDSYVRNQEDLHQKTLVDYSS